MVDIPILLKRNANAGTAPLVSDLQLGEVAINTFDGDVFIKKDDGVESIVRIGDLANDDSPSLSTTLDASGFDIINVADPTNAQDAATKAYVDSVGTGLRDFKKSVRVLTDSNVDLASAVDQGPYDGVTLADGEDIALVGQTAAAENGLYTAVTASDPTTWVRRSDADADAEVTGGMYFFVNEGTSYGDSAWVLSTNDPIILDTTALTFVQFSSLGQVTAGDGLTKTGNTLDVVGTAGRISVASDSIDIDATFGLAGLADVDATLAPNDGEILQYVAANSRFEAVAAIDGGSY